MKKVTAVISAVCILMSCMSLFAFAADKIYYAESETYDMLDFNPETKISLPTDAAMTGFYGSSNPDTPYMFYSQLTDSQKTIYNTLLSAGVKETVAIKFGTPYTGTGVDTTEALNNLKAVIMNEVIAAFSAVVEDNPMMFWHSGFKYSFSYSIRSSGAQETVSTSEISLTITLDKKSYADFTVVSQLYSQLESAVEAFEVNGFSRYEKVKSIHDRLCDTVVYPDDINLPMSHQPTGALLNGFAVCEGYAEAFKLICDRENIPCITAVGTGNGGAHKWNYVKMDDGKWYLLDATWNDQSRNIYYDYLLSGTETVTPNFSPSKPDSAVHIATGKMFNADFSLVYPSISSEAYSYGVLGANAGDMAFNNTNGVLYVGMDKYDFLDKILCPAEIDGQYFGDSITGSRVVFDKPSNGTSREYLVVMRGDIVPTDSLDEYDYEKLCRVASAQEKAEEGSAEFYAGDFNQDGAIDAFDAIDYDLYVNGLLEF